MKSSRVVTEPTSIFCCNLPQLSHLIVSLLVPLPVRIYTSPSPATLLDRVNFCVIQMSSDFPAGAIELSSTVSLALKECPPPVLRIGRLSSILVLSPLMSYTPASVKSFMFDTLPTFTQVTSLTSALKVPTLLNTSSPPIISLANEVIVYAFPVCLQYTLIPTKGVGILYISSR